MKRYFRNEDDEYCYPKKYWQETMKEEGVKEIELFEADVLKDDQFFFCKAVCEVGERGNCGKQCEDYAPRNGKSGCCKHFGQLYESGKKVTITLTPLHTLFKRGDGR